MTDTPAISYPVALTPAEMAVLLSLAGGRTLLGLEQPDLIPANSAAWEQRFLQGRSELERNRWLEHIPGTVYYHLNEHLGVVAATVAAPTIVVVTNLDWPGLPRQRVAHYLAAAVAEACFDGQRFQLAALRSVDVMLARLASAIGLPAQPPPWSEFELANEAARRAVSDPQPERLAQLGVPEPSVAPFSQALRNGQPRASVQVMSVRYGQVVANQRVRALFARGREAWLAMPMNGARVRLTPASAGGLAAAVQALLQAA